MLTVKLAAALTRFVDTAEEIANTLDFELEVPEARLPPAPAGPPHWRRPESAWLWDSWAAFERDARRCGPSAAPIFLSSITVRDLLDGLLDGPLDDWRSQRDRVLALVARMRTNCRADADDLPPPSPRAATNGGRHQGETLVGQKGDKRQQGEKLRPRTGRRRGRQKNRDGDSAADRAAFWMTTAPDLVPDGDALQESLAAMGLEPSPKDVYEAMKLHGLEITLGSVRNNVPACWPRLRDGSPRPSWSFAEYAADVSVESFARNLRGHRMMMRGRDVVPRAASKTWDLQTAAETRGPRSGPSPSEIRTMTIVKACERVEDELGRVQTAMKIPADAAPAWERLRIVLVNDLRLDDAAASELMGQRNKAAIEAIATSVMKVRKKAGDTGDFDPKRRLV
jgi:hypothetical protein